MENSNNHRGYKTLPFFQQSEIIHDFTVEFCRKFIDPKSRTNDQMEQAARSGKQNISEGYAQENYKGKDMLLRVSRGSLEELLQDYHDFLRQKGLPLWNKEDPRAKEVRNLVYKIKDYKNYNSYKEYSDSKNYKDYKNYKPYNIYKTYLDTPEGAANAMVCLINQTNMILNQKLRWIRNDMPKEASFSAREMWLHRQMQKQREKEENFDRRIKEMIEGKKPHDL